MPNINKFMSGGQSTHPDTCVSFQKWCQAPSVKSVSIWMHWIFILICESCCCLVVSYMYITAIHMQWPGCSVSVQWIRCIAPWMLTGKMKYDTLVGWGVWFCLVCSVLNFVLCWICVAAHSEYCEYAVSLCANPQKSRSCKRAVWARGFQSLRICHISCSGSPLFSPQCVSQESGSHSCAHDFLKFSHHWKTLSWDWT